MTGWECPRCHSCYAPHIAKCDGCGPKEKSLRERVNQPSIRFPKLPNVEDDRPGPYIAGALPPWPVMLSACTGFGLPDDEKPWINRAVPDCSPMY